MLLDVATGGELHVALAAGVPAGSLVFHGNNKSASELRSALDAGVARVVVDSFAELGRIEALVAEGLPDPRVLIRVNPGVEAHTHEYLKTGVVDSKFGLSVASGEAAEALERAGESTAMDLMGVHAHIGSQVFLAESFERAVAVLAQFAAPFDLDELSVGGGLGVAYIEGETAPSITEWGQAVHAACEAHAVKARITAEPGRAIAAQAAITLYEVGTIKDIRDVRTYVSVDGGMSDNPRPVLYGSGYEAFLPRATGAPRPLAARIVGKHCESGDVIVRDAALPDDLTMGDVLATPVTGAYGYSMGSNYNMVPRPAVVFVAEGDARLVVRRETYDDMLSRDLALG